MEHLTRKLAFVVGALLLFGSVPAMAVQYVFGRADFPAGNAPSSVAKADFNGDGAVDVAVTNAVDNTVSIFLGKQNSTFAPQVDYPTGETPVSVIVADFNGDGKLDLAIANVNGNSISVLLGNGDGTFQPHVDYATDFAPVSLATADLNNDHKPDLVASTQSLAVSVLLGHGDGTFGPYVSYQDAGGAGAGPAGTVTLADFDGNGTPDIAVAVPLDNAVSILLGRGNGTFHTYVEYATPEEPSAVAAADFNRDGYLDLAVTAASANTVSILLGNGNGTFQRHVDYPTGPYPAFVGVADFNGDGKLDLAVADANCTYSPCGFGSISILLGVGDGTFQPHVDYGTGTNPSFTITDVNRDGRLDLVIAHQTCIEYTPCGPGVVSVLLGNGDGTFPTTVPIAIGGDPGSAAAADFNGDGKLDLAIVNATSGLVSILLGNGNGTFQTPMSYSAGSNPGAITVGDFNNDGKLDLAVTTSANAVAILLGNGDGTFQAPQTSAAGQLPSFIVTGDFNRDGNLDLAVVNNAIYGEGFSVLLGNGNGTFQAPVNYTAPFAGGLVVGDFNGDGILDVVASTGVASPGSIFLFLGTGNGQFAAPVTVPADYGGPITKGDFNGDGHLDLAVTDDCNCAQLEVLLGNGDGTFQPPLTYATGTGPGSIVVGEFTGNRKLDLATANILDGTVSIIPGNGDGTFRTHLDYSIGYSPYLILPGDFNGDGTSDLLAWTVMDNNLAALFSQSTIAIFPGSLKFGPEPVDKTSPPKTLTLTNPGSAPLRIFNFHLGGPDAADFKETNACPSAINVGSKCAVDVTFTPGGTGSRTGALSIYDNAPSPQKIKLAGTGN